MSSMDKLQHSTAGVLRESSGTWQPEDTKNNNNVVEQISFSGTVNQQAFPDAADMPTGAVPVAALEVNPRAMTSVLAGPITSPGVMRKQDYTPLPEVRTESLILARSTTTALREQVVIRGKGKSLKKSEPLPRPSTRRRMALQMVVTSLVGVVLLGALLAVIPVGGGHTAMSLITGSLKQVPSTSHNTGLVAQQAATATAVMQDGYDDGSYYAGLPTAPASYTSTFNPFNYGQCTYWSDYRYHYLTGHWVPWTGNASVWGYGAQRFDWTVSTLPHLYSIIVLQPGVQNAGPFGHVAVVEKINPDGSVLTSNWNWTGPFATTSWVTFWPGGSTRFVWYPGA